MNEACDLVHELAEELALNQVTGVERAAALAHLEACHSCRADVAALTEAAEAVLLLSPAVPPDPGFEQRVLARLSPGLDGTAPDRRTPSRHRRHAVLALAAALLVGVVLAAAVLTGGAPSTETAVADMRARNGDVVGQVAVRSDDGTLVEMALPGWDALVRRYDEPGPPYWLDLSLADGTRQRVALEPSGDGDWTVPVAVDASDITAAAITDAAGRVWCRAEFL